MGKLLNTKIYESSEKLCEALAEAIAADIDNTLGEQDRFDLALAGGDTPGPLYSRLAEDYRDKITWRKIRFFWSDERYVPYSDPHSNYGLAKMTLLDKVPAVPSRIFPMPTSYEDPAAASDAYEIILKSQFDSEWPHFDLAILGLGDDCHIASLFPHTASLGEKVRWVVTTLSPREPVQRLSLTLPVINASRKIYFMVTGDRKAEAVARTLSKERIEFENCPAGEVHPTDGELIWWLDRAAAKLIKR